MQVTKVQSSYQRGRRTRGRVYFNPVGETLLENLVNRRARPYNEFRKLFPQVREQLAAQGVHLPEGAKPRWSRYAGCSCPCSPGFLVDALYGQDVWVEVSA